MTADRLPISTEAFEFAGDGGARRLIRRAIDQVIEQDLFKIEPGADPSPKTRDVQQRQEDAPVICGGLLTRAAGTEAPGSPSQEGQA